MHAASFGPSPSYIRDVLVPVSEMQGRTHLRSAAAGLYDVPFTQTQFGCRAFSVAAPSEWNSLPVNIRQIPNITQLKRALKTHYFTEAYFTRQFLIKLFSFIILLLLFLVKRRWSVQKVLYKLGYSNNNINKRRNNNRDQRTDMTTTINIMQQAIVYISNRLS